MKPRGYTSEGIVLTRKIFGEADRIISIYSKDRGRISLIAKGVRKPESRKRGHIEVFNLVKFQGAIGHGLDIMLEAEVINDFKNVRKSLKKISLAYYLMEVVGRITHEGESNEELFNLISSSLTKLETTKELKKLRLNFLQEILTLLGYWPKGTAIPDLDEKLEEVIERQIYSERVGKRMIS
jgi:DNA repair protein RecO (recombination protein O)